MTPQDPTQAPGSLLDSTLDRKNTALGKLVYHLRQDMDIYRVIGLNVPQVEEHGVSKNFWAHSQRLAHESLALNFCKVYEAQNPRYELNSIPGCLSSLNDVPTDAAQRAAIEKFATTYGFAVPWTDAQTHLTACFAYFATAQAAPLELLKHYRDKMGAHSEFEAKIEYLPSQDSSELLWEFAYGFYCLIAEHILDVVPSPMGRQVGMGMRRVLNQLGVADVKWDLPKI